MIKFKHYPKSFSIDSEGCLFRKYSLLDERFAQYVDGTLAELRQDDFGGVTRLPEYSISNFDNLEYIEIPETVIQASASAIVHCPNIKKIVFPSSFANFEETFLSSVFCNFKNEVTLDFSKAKQIPTMTKTNVSTTDTFHANVVEIKVPSSLYNEWITTEPWNNDYFASRIVSV